MKILGIKKGQLLRRGLCIFMASLLLSAQMITVRASDEVVYYHNDTLGSPIAATNEQGNLLWREDYKPYGERILKQDAGKNSLWYTGKPEEKDLGINYFGARWYDPSIGRFIAMDPVPFQEQNIHSFNRYAYANNNPVKYIDPTGGEPMFFTYVVGRGDTLSNIAKSWLGSFSDYKVLLEFNPQISDPNFICPGNEIRIPIGSVNPQEDPLIQSKIANLNYELSAVDAESAEAHRVIAQMRRLASGEAQRDFEKGLTYKIGELFGAAGGKDEVDTKMNINIDRNNQKRAQTEVNIAMGKIKDTTARRLEIVNQIRKLEGSK